MNTGKYQLPLILNEDFVQLKQTKTPCYFGFALDK